MRAPRHLMSACLAFTALATGCSLARDASLPAYKIMAALAGESLPATLAETHLFEDTDPLRPSFGVVGFDVHAPLWTDGAHKRRYIFVPPKEAIGYDAVTGALGFPVGTAVAKHFMTEDGAPLETRIITLKEGNQWAFGTYVWKDGVATLSLNPTTVDAPDGRQYRIPSEKECRLCHNADAIDPPVIGFALNQLNWQPTGKMPMLDILAKEALFKDDVAVLKTAAVLPNPANTSLDLNTRARAYLAINCSSCHRPGGPALEQKFDLRYELSNEETRLVAEGKVVPGQPDASPLWQKFTASVDRMPPLSIRQDPLGTELLKAWIEQWPKN